MTQGLLNPPLLLHVCVAVQTYAREREAAHERALQLHAQTQVSQTTVPAQTAMATTANASRGFGVVGGPMVIGQENYCGPVSWIIGLFLFPCICFCESPNAGPALGCKP